MKTSFYFPLWILAYIIIGLSGIQFLVENAFIMALILVFILAGVANKIFRSQIESIAVRECHTIFEAIYTNNIKLFISRTKYNAIIEGVFLIYLLSCLCFLLSPGISTGFLELVLFGFFAYRAAVCTHKEIKAYITFKRDGSINNDNISLILLSDQAMEAYEQYHAERSTRSADELRPPLDPASGRLRVFSMICAILSILIGLFFISSSLPILIFGEGEIGLYGIMMTLYAGMALFYGIKDLIDSVRGN